MGYECRTRDFSTKLGAVFFLLLVLAAVAVVNGTPFDVPGRTLASQHKQMRYQPFSSLQTQQILAESGSFTFRVSSQNQLLSISMRPHFGLYWWNPRLTNFTKTLLLICGLVSFSISPCNTQIPAVVLFITLAIRMLPLLLSIKQKQALNFTQGVGYKSAMYVVH